jgi:iron-sulfur cluster assembly accessory protein
MNPQPHLILVSIVLVAGCADSASTPNALRTRDNGAATNVGVAGADVRERSVVILTDAAVEKFTEFLNEEPGKHIRLSVTNEGPTGFIYDLKIDDSINATDFVDRSHGLTLVVDPKSALYLEGATIDWQTRMDGTAGFKFDNPNAAQQ